MTTAISFEHSPFMRFLGLEVVRADKGVIEVRLPFREELLRHDGSDWLHGGVVSALAFAVLTGIAAGSAIEPMAIRWRSPARCC